MAELTPPRYSHPLHDSTRSDSSLSPAPSPHNFDRLPSNSYLAQHSQTSAFPNSKVLDDSTIALNPQRVISSSSSLHIPKSHPAPPSSAIHGIASATQPHPKLGLTAEKPAPKPRKRKAPDSGNTASDPPKEKKPRKPREPRALDENGKPIRKTKATTGAAKASPTASAFASMKKATSGVNASTAAAAPKALNGPSSTTATSLSTIGASKNAANTPQTSTKSMNPSHPPVRAAQVVQSGSEAPPRPSTSGQRYDPIRGVTIDRPVPASTPPPKVTTVSPSANRSPTVANLIHGPDQPVVAAKREPGVKPVSVSKSLTKARAEARPTTTSNPTSAHTGSKPFAGSPLATPSGNPVSVPPKPVATFKPITSKPVISKPVTSKPVTSNPVTSKPVPSKSVTVNTAPSTDGAMDVNPPAQSSYAPTNGLAVSAEQTEPRTTSTGPTPKSKRPTPPLSKIQPTGSGLLSSSDLFGGPSTIGATDSPGGVSIEFRIVLDPKGCNTVNIAQEIIKRYGREALDPRAVAHRERLLQVAAAANRLDQGSGDDMSLDLSDPDNESNADMAKSNNEGNAPNGRKRRRVEEYDKEDDFIDDTEMAWEQQAAVAKDGFFVYCGPLVPEEKEKPDSAVPAKGRGRGRGGKAKVVSEPSTSRPPPTVNENGDILNADGSVRKKPGPRPKNATGTGDEKQKKPRKTKAQKEAEEKDVQERDTSMLIETAA